MATIRRKPAATRRLRRTSDEARAAILDAAERSLAEIGPAAIRLQEVAEQVGVSHPTLLHHFGSREALVKAVVERALAALQVDVIQAIQGASDGEDNVPALLDRISAALATNGHGRALAWCALSGMTPAPDAQRLRQVAELVHPLRLKRHGHRHPPSFEDTLFTLLLAMFSLFAQSVAGPMMLEAAGLPAGPETEQRFRRWLAGVLVAHLEKGSERG
ncbi:MAG: helix-turn-helix domain-containing protein [Byssovorax sp.]